MNGGLNESCEYETGKPSFLQNQLMDMSFIHSD